MSNREPITVDLGDLQDRVDARVSSGAYSSPSEVLRAGLLALEREDAARDEDLRQKVREALVDARPDVAAEDVFARLKAKHVARTQS